MSAKVGTDKIRLTERDLRILKALREYQVLSTSQIQRLFFPSRCRALKRLNLLRNQELLRRHLRRVAPCEGSVEALYLPSRRGLRTLFQHDHSGRYYSSKIGHPPSDLFLEHTLARNDFRIAVESASNKCHGVSFQWWRHDKSIGLDCPQTYSNSLAINGPRRIVPDGLFAVDYNGRTLHYYVEIDRGTMSLQRIRSKMMAYVYHEIQSWAASREESDTQHVLWVTTSRQRQSNLKSISESLEYRRASSKLFRFSHDEQLYGNSESRAFWIAWECPHTTRNIGILPSPPNIHS